MYLQRTLSAPATYGRPRRRFVARPVPRSSAVPLHAMDSLASTVPSLPVCLYRHESKAATATAPSRRITRPLARSLPTSPPGTSMSRGTRVDGGSSSRRPRMCWCWERRFLREVRPSPSRFLPPLDSQADSPSTGTHSGQQLGCRRCRAHTPSHRVPPSRPASSAGNVGWTGVLSWTAGGPASMR